MGLRKILIGSFFLIVLIVLFLRRRKKRLAKNITNYGPNNRQKILRIERIYQREKGITSPNSACGPTTAAMIIHYLIEKGTPFKGNYKKMSTVQLVNDLYDRFSTRPWGTSSRRWRGGMERFLNKNSAVGNWSASIHRAEGNFLPYCQSIDENMPVVLRFTFNRAEHSFASHHYILGIGYAIRNHEPFVAVLDADGGKLNEGIHWIHWNENERFMKMIQLHKKVEENNMN